jgi:DNA-binding GntR family transcriptional regulator
MKRSLSIAASDAQQAAALHVEDRMYAALYAAIMEHRLHAGAKLTEQGLADIYGAARYNVRRVLMRLAADGLIDLRRNRGASIASPTEREARDMFELRQTLEQSVITKAATNARPLDFMRLRELIAREREAYMQGDRPRWIRLSADFHIELARLGGNALVVDTLRRLVSRTTLMLSAPDSSGKQPCSFDEHAAILDALQANDIHGARGAMLHHLDRCACRMLRRADKTLDLRTALGQPDAHDNGLELNIKE